MQHCIVKNPQEEEIEIQGRPRPTARTALASAGVSQHVGHALLKQSSRLTTGARSLAV